MSRELYTKRFGAHYGNKGIKDGKPVIEIKAGHKADYVTINEIAEDLYGMQVESIIFKEPFVNN